MVLKQGEGVTDVEGVMDLSNDWVGWLVGRPLATAGKRSIF